MSNRALAGILIACLAGVAGWVAYAVFKLSERHGAAGFAASAAPFCVTIALLLRGYAHIGNPSELRTIPRWAVPIGAATLGSIAIALAKTTWVVGAVAGGAGAAFAGVIAGLGGAAW